MRSPDYETVVTGTAQSVPAQSPVICLNMETGHDQVAQAAAEGSFQTRLFAAPGGWILVKSDTSGAFTAMVG